MQHLMFGEKSLLVGDAAAAEVARYAAHLGRLRSADVVEVEAIGPDGHGVTASMLLNSGTVLISETADADLPEPDNAPLIAYIQTQLAQFELSASALPDPLDGDDD